jgi:hypothetical protein
MEFWRIRALRPTRSILSPTLEHSQGLVHDRRHDEQHVDRVQGRLNETFGVGGVAVPALNSFEIGRTPGNPVDRTFRGDIAETLYFPRVLTAVESNRVESYLALKYGVTLNGPTTPGDPADYTSSTASVVWSGVANPTYHNDVAGIAVTSTWIPRARPPLVSASALAARWS